LKQNKINIKATVVIKHRGWKRLERNMRGGEGEVRQRLEMQGGVGKELGEHDTKRLGRGRSDEEQR
jgi:hypothetical protein